MRPFALFLPVSRRGINWLKVLAWLHLLGGVTGIGFAFYHMLTQIDRYPFIWFLGSLALFPLSIGAGVLELRGTPDGARLGLITEALQVLQFSTGTFAYTFMSGFQALLYVTSTNVGMDFGVRSAFAFGPVSGSRFLAIDVFCFLTIPYLLRHLRSTQGATSATAESVSA